MKVLIAIPCLLRGGTEMQTLSLAKVLKTLSHEVLLVCYFEHDNTIVTKYENEGVGQLLQPEHPRQENYKI